MIRQVKVDHLHGWSRIFRSEQTEMAHSIWCTNRNFRSFGLNGKRPRILGADHWKSYCGVVWSYWVRVKVRVLVIILVYLGIKSLTRLASNSLRLMALAFFSSHIDKIHLLSQWASYYRTLNEPGWVARMRIISPQHVLWLKPTFINWLYKLKFFSQL